MATLRADNKEILGLHDVFVIESLYGDRIGRPARGCPIRYGRVPAPPVFHTAVDDHLNVYTDAQ